MSEIEIDHERQAKKGLLAQAKKIPESQPHPDTGNTCLKIFI
jgi:hypothetical protein